MTPGAMLNASCRSAVSGNDLCVPIAPGATVRDLRRRLYCQLYADDPSMEGREHQIHLLADQGPVADAEQVDLARTYQYPIVAADVAEDLEAIRRTMSLISRAFVGISAGREVVCSGSQARRGLDGHGKPLAGALPGPRACGR